jgi:hypothetical protein
LNSNINAHPATFGRNIRFERDTHIAPQIIMNSAPG